MKKIALLISLALFVLLAACSQTPIPSDSLEVQADVSKVSIAVTYDYAAKRNEKEASFNQNGHYEKPELSLGGFPVYITPVDKEGNIIGETMQYETKASADPLESLNVELPFGYYYIDSPLPDKTQGGDSINWAKTSKETLVLVDGQADIHLVNLLRTCSEVVKGTYTVADYLALLQDTNTVYQIYQPCEPLTFSLYTPPVNEISYDDPTPFTNLGNGLCTNAAQPSIVRDGTDKAIIAYQCLDGTLNGMPKHSVYVKRWNGSAWINYGASARINTTTTVDARTPSLAITSTGNPVIAWVETNANNTVSKIYIKEWNGLAWVVKGSAITPPNDPQQPLPGNYLADKLQLVLSSNNNPFVAWHNSAVDDIYVYGWNGSSWKDYKGIGTYYLHAIDFSLALTSNNLPILATESDNVTVQHWNNTMQDWVMFVDASSGASALDIDIQSSTKGVSLVLDRNNNPVVAWNEPFGAVPGLYVKRWNGSSWSVVGNTSYNNQPRPVAQPWCNGSCVNPSISIDSSNRPVLAYVDNGSVYVQRYDTVRTGRNQWIQLGSSLKRNVGLADSTDMVLKTNGLPIVTWQETATVSPWTTNVFVSQR